MGIYATKSKWQQALRPIVDFCVRRSIPPDVFIYAALALSGLAGMAYFLAEDAPRWLWLAPPCVLLRLLLNLLDGQVARGLGVADAWGEVKNEFGDRLADAAIFLGLTFGGYVDGRIAALALALILMTSFLGVLSKALGGPRIYGGLFGKGDRMISLALFTLYPALTGRLAAFDLYLILAALAAGVTIAQRLRILYAHTQSTG